MYIVLAALTFASFMAAIVAVFTGHYGIAGHQIVIFVLAGNALRAEQHIDRLVITNIRLWQHVRDIKQGATPEGDTP